MPGKEWENDHDVWARVRIKELLNGQVTKGETLSLYIFRNALARIFYISVSTFNLSTRPRAKGKHLWQQSEGRRGQKPSTSRLHSRKSSRCSDRSATIELRCRIFPRIVSPNRRYVPKHITILILLSCKIVHMSVNLFFRSSLVYWWNFLPPLNLRWRILHI